MPAQQETTPAAAPTRPGLARTIASTRAERAIEKPTTTSAPRAPASTVKAIAKPTASAAPKAPAAAKPETPVPTPAKPSTNSARPVVRDVNLDEIDSLLASIRKG
jgi:hypothetical protein